MLLHTSLVFIWRENRSGILQFLDRPRFCRFVPDYLIGDVYDLWFQLVGKTCDGRETAKSPNVWDFPECQALVPQFRPMLKGFCCSVLPIKIKTQLLIKEIRNSLNPYPTFEKKWLKSIPYLYNTIQHKAILYLSTLRQGAHGARSEYLIMMTKTSEKPATLQVLYRLRETLRICQYCCCDQIENEVHFLFHCDRYNNVSHK